MKTQFFPGESSSTLRLFFAGWGMDARPFASMLGAVDTVVIWDYTVLDAAPLAPYLSGRVPEVLAWSMGVWAAGQVLAGVPVASATAVNGTPWPIDDARGIPRAVFEGTLAGFSEAGLLRFRRRMCGGAAGLKGFEAVAPQRTVADLHAELAALERQIAAAPAADFAWTRAIACSEDRIFPLAAQVAAFPEAEVRPGAHWAPELFARLLRGEAP